jgi:glycosyltransferase involved in cell wall biosynthesis
MVKAVLSTKVVMAGPCPPAVGGMVSVMDDLARSRLRERFVIETFDTAKSTREGRSIAEAVVARFALWRRWWMQLAGASIAHIHTCSGLSFFLDGALAVLARLRGVPAVLHIHGGRFDTFLDELDPLRGVLARAIARGAARVIVLSDSWRERLAARLPGAALSVVENGIAMPPPVERAAATRPVVLFLGAICRDKGVFDLVRAVADAQLGARLDARIVLVGPETEAGATALLRKLAAELGVGDRFEVAGTAVGPAKDQWFARAEVFVLPSYIEGLPMSLLEAMAAGLAIVATRVGAIASAIDNGRNGLLVEAGDVSALAAALARLCGDAPLRQALGRAARATCAARFTLDRAAADVERIYLELSAARAAAARA